MEKKQIQAVRKEKIFIISSLALLLIIVRLNPVFKEIGQSLEQIILTSMAKITSGFIFEAKAGYTNSHPRLEKYILTLPLISTEKFNHILKREKITVALIDSGLGGLSIMAEAASHLEKTKFYRQVDLVFFNALFSSEGGYNALPSRQARLEMFDRVLFSLEKKIKPDLIFVACNTLSTLYPSTQFARKARIPVYDIIQPGIALLRKNLQEKPAAVAIILATPVTINEDTHRKQLLQEGFSSNRLVTQACPELEVFIEKEPEGEETALLISAFLNEALAKIPVPRPPVILSLNCTHYGYSLTLWERAARENGLDFTIVNPNSDLIDLWLKPDWPPRFSKTEIKAKCLSKVPIEEKRRQNLASFLKKISPLIAEALLNYKYDPDLF